MQDLRIGKRQCLDGIPTVKLGLRSIDAFRPFNLIGAKQAVPDNEHRGKILIDVFIVDGMVDPMV